MNNLSVVLQEQGKWQQAEEMYSEVLEVRRQVLGEHHPDTLGSRGNLATILEEQGKSQQAEEMYREVLEVECQVLGEHHPDTLASRGNLATILQKQGKWQQAEEMQKEVLEVKRRVLGEDHPDTLTSKNSLAVLLHKQDKWQAAEEMHKKVLEVRSQVLGEHHPDTLISMNNLSIVLQQRDRDDWKFRFSLDESSHCSRLIDAIIKLRTAIGVQKHRVDDDHPYLLMQRVKLARLLLQMNEESSLQEAEELLRQLIPSLQKQFGPKDRLTQGATSDLVFLLEDQGRDAEEWQQQLLPIVEEVDSTMALAEEQYLEEILLREEWEGSEEAAELLRDFVRKQQERYRGLMARSSEPSSDRKSASRSRLSDRPLDAPAAFSSGSASQSASNSVPSESCLRPLRSCESSDDGTSSDSSAWLKAALEEKCLEIQKREKQPEI